MRNQNHPGVCLVPGHKPSYPYHLSFKHPLLAGKQVKRSARTPDGAQAAQIAIELSTILRNPNVWRKLPSETSEFVRAIWNGDVINGTLLATFEKARPKGFYGDFYKPDWLKLQDHEELRKAAERLLEDNKRLFEANAVLETEVDNLSALLKKLGVEAAKEYVPKLLSQAYADFLSDDKSKCGTNACDRRKVTLRAWFRRFSSSLPAGKIVHEVTTQDVIEHLAQFKSGKLKNQKGKPIDGSVKSLAFSLCAMLEHQSSGAFRKAPVKDWVKKHLNGSSGDIQTAPYWLDQNDVDALLNHMPDFWRDVAGVQWEGGFRPEELAHLCRDRVTLNGEVRIEVAAIHLNGNLFWKPKTRQSCGKVHLRENSRKTLETLVVRDSFLLFPNDSSLHQGIETRWGEDEAIEAKYKLWRVTAWNIQYVAALRSAAEKAKLDSDRIDGRTLRRSCGKRVLLESNFNLELAAAILRDRPETVRAHYARLLPEDVRQPETAK